MQAIVERCRKLNLFQELDPQSLQTLVEEGRWFSVAGGDALFSEGDAAEYLYFSLTGRFIVVRGADHVVGYIRAGELIGEMALLSGEDHSANVFALRDSEVLMVPAKTIRGLLERSASFAALIARIVVERARHPKASFHLSAPRVFALVASSPSIPIEYYARTLAEAVSRYGRTAIALDETAHRPDFELDMVESSHDVVILACRVSDSPWYRFVLRHSDRLLVFARRDSRPPSPFPLSPFPKSPARRFRLVDLVTVEEGQDAMSLTRWVEAIDANRLFRWAGEAGLDRLARAIAGRTVALVLSGGGARAYAHIGAVRALRERGVPIDFICGTSMGAVIGACVAKGWDNAEIEARIRDAFVDTNPLGDHVLPVVALTRGRRVDQRLEMHFGGVMIEDLEIPFSCVSAELTKGEVRVHRRGLLRMALRASLSLPGVLPPVVDGEALLVDGAVMNNFPTDIVAEIHRGVTIGIDVARHGTLSPEPFINPPGFLRWVLRHGFRTAPPIVALLMRAATAPNAGKARGYSADIVITPAVEGVTLRGWRMFETAVEDGYHATIAALDAHAARLEPIVGPRRRGLSTTDRQP